MSATKRGTTRRGADFYPTPESAFKPMLPYLQTLRAAGLREVWEPACGDRRLVRWMCEAGFEAGGSDLSEGYNFLEDRGRYTTILTNPPFSLAVEFCDHANRLARNVFMLLRLNFLASRKRRDWWRRNPPGALFILSKRPSFTDDGATDATDYAWFYWGDMYRGFLFL